MLLQDLRYAVRTLLANPGFAMTAILCLSLGIGLNSAIFSVVDGILLQPFPYAGFVVLLFSLLGTPPASGRDFDPRRDDRAGTRACRPAPSRRRCRSSATTRSIAQSRPLDIDQRVLHKRSSASCHRSSCFRKRIGVACRSRALLRTLDGALQSRGSLATLVRAHNLIRVVRVIRGTPRLSSSAGCSSTFRFSRPLNRQ